MDKLNLARKDRAYYSAKQQPTEHTFPEFSYLMIEGKGRPAGDAFNEAVGALYPMAYGVKRLYKLAQKDFVVPKLEGLWWVESHLPALQVSRDEWQWKLMIRMPEFVTRASVEIARKEVMGKKNLMRIKDVLFDTYKESRSVQILHVGSYESEPESLSKINQYLIQHGLEENGLHHEIYLSDPRKVDSDKLKTILRYPVK